MLHLLTLLQGSLLFTWGKRLLKLSVDEEVAQDAAGTPRDAVSPSLDTGSMLLIDEDVAAPDEILTLSVVWSSRYVIELTG